MNRDQDKSELVELGTASTVTLGVPIGTKPEAVGFYALGLDQE